MHCGDHREALLTLIGALDHGFLVFKTLADGPFFFLPGFSLHVDRQNHKVDDETHHNDGPTPLLCDIKAPKERLVHPEFKRGNKEGV